MFEQLCLPSAQQPTLLIFDPYSRGHFEIERVRRLHQMFPSVALIAYSDFRSRPAQEAGMLALAGVNRLITLGLDDHPSLIREAIAYVDTLGYERLRAVLARNVGERRGEVFLRVYRAVGELMSSSCLPQARTSGTMNGILRQELASVTGVANSRRAIERSLAVLNLPPPRKLIELARLLHAGRLLDDPGRSIANVASMTGYDLKLYQVIKRALGITPNVLRRMGAFETVLSMIELRLRIHASTDRQGMGLHGVPHRLSRNGSPMTHSGSSASGRRH